MRHLILLVPPEAAVLVIALAGLALVVGARRWARMLFAFGVALVLVPPLLAPIFDALPTWVLLAVLVLLGLGVLRALSSLLIGQRATDHMVGILAADVVRLAVSAPFRILGLAFRALRGLLGYGR